MSEGCCAGTHHDSLLHVLHSLDQKSRQNSLAFALQTFATALSQWTMALTLLDLALKWKCREDDFPVSSTYEAYLQRNIDMLAEYRSELCGFGLATP